MTINKKITVLKMMNRLTIKKSIMLLIVAIFMVGFFPIKAFALTSGDYKFDVNGDGTCTITDYVGTQKSISIPTSLNGYKVTKIGEHAFRGKQLMTVIIPSSVTTIGAESFSWNILTSITIPQGVKTIDDYAFFENNLTSANIPNSVTSIGNWGFAFNKLSNITIPKSVISIGDWAFLQNSLNSVNLPSSLITIGEGAFCENKLTSFKLPATLDKWFDGNGKSYSGSTTVKDMETSYQNSRYYIQISAEANYTNSTFNTHKITVANTFDCDVTTRIIDSSGKTVKNIEYYKEYSAGSHEVFWDGYDSNGKNVKPGIFYIVAIARLNDGLIKYTKKQLVYDDHRVPDITTQNTYTKVSDNTHPISVNVKFDCELTVRITDANGKTVKNIEYYQPYTAGMHTVYWDGKNSGGTVVPPGIYQIVAIERDDNGNIWYKKKSFELEVIKTPAISSNSTYTKTGANRHLVTFSISDNAKVTVAIKDKNKKTIRVIEYKNSFDEGQHNVYWDGKDNYGNVVAPSEYYIYVIRYDEDGSYYYRRKKLNFALFNYPTIYSNSYYTRTGSNRHLIKVDIATDSDVSTCIKDANFKTVLYLEYKVHHEDGRFYVYWDGKDKNGNDVPNGTYYIYAIKYNEDGTYKWRRKKLTLN